MYKNETSFDRILRMPDVQRMTGLSRSSIYRLIAQGNFPSAIKLSSLAVGWRQSAIEVWLLQRASLGMVPHHRPVPSNPISSK
ncbi:helix-turn-helix transcriptional regulator [Halothiobacillus sp.]|jgi:prophage regulatory protein|uniref:helix-turn-helix transcriptional regulator n=1 Tax=Halothiobacillus sp. TaxID=1891311 RepID=UPI0029849D55|nr:AlpA family phage regulatory protein [Halothiobacillus sp.]MDY0147169.1 AlpA family phage regulatory protein [Halothiobacillus sp.]